MIIGLWEYFDENRINHFNWHENVKGFQIDFFTGRKFSPSSMGWQRYMNKDPWNEEDVLEFYYDKSLGNMGIKIGEEDQGIAFKEDLDLIEMDLFFTIIIGSYSEECKLEIVNQDLNAAQAAE